MCHDLLDSFITACEEEFIPEISSDPPEIVVEGLYRSRRVKVSHLMFY